MKWPISCVDNFFDSPEEIINMSKNLEYKKSDDGGYPGVRSYPLHTINEGVFRLVTKKILALLYPTQLDSINYTARSHFQKVRGQVYKNEGWVHDDRGNEFTAIIYLTNNINCGTSIWKPKKFGNEIIHTDEKHERFKNPNSVTDLYEKAFLEKNNSRFIKTCSFASIFNRLVMFDSYNFHAVDNYGSNDDSERLTLITFFDDIYFPKIKYPITQMRRTI